MKKIVRNSKGFSLPELLVIMFVISALAAGTYTLMQIIRMKGQVTKCLKDTREISAAMSTFYDDVGAWPCSRSGAADLSGNSYVGFVQGKIPKDTSTYPKGTDRKLPTGLSDLKTGQVTCAQQYRNVPAGAWGGPYLQLETDHQGLPISPWKGKMYPIYHCPSAKAKAAGEVNKGITGFGVNNCEYGIAISNMPKKAAQELSKKVNGNKDFSPTTGLGKVFVAVQGTATINGVTLFTNNDYAPQNYNGYLFVGEE